MVWAFNFSDGSKGPDENLPRERRLRHEAQDNVHPFAIEVVLPLAHLPVLQDHVHCKDIEEKSDGYVYPVHEVGDAATSGKYRADEVNSYHYPRDDPGEDPEIIRRPIRLLCCLVIQLHHESKEVHAGVEGEQRD